jgi:hypothetical protein
MYRLKHIPTGLFYKPVGGTQSNLSKLGKVYSREANAKASYGHAKSIRVYVKEGSKLHRDICDKLKFEKAYNYNNWNKNMFCDTPISDWIIEELKIQ